MSAEIPLKVTLDKTQAAAQAQELQKEITQGEAKAQKERAAAAASLEKQKQAALLAQFKDTERQKTQESGKAEKDRADAAASLARQKSAAIYAQFQSAERQKTQAAAAAERERAAAAASLARQKSAALIQAFQQDEAKKQQIMSAFGVKGADSFGAIATAAGAAAGVIGVVLGTIKTMSAEFDKVGAKARAMSAQFGAGRDKDRELAQVEGKQATDDFHLNLLRFGKKTGLREDEARQFRLGAFNSGAQFKGKTIGESDFEQYLKTAGAYTTAKGVDAGTAGELGGTFLGFKDYSKLAKGKQSEAAIADLNKSFSVLQRGKGDTSILAKQLSLLGGSGINQDEQKGTFKDAEEASIAISTAAEANQSTAAEQIQAANRGLRGFTDKDAAPLLKKAGIDAKTGFLASIEKLKPVVEAEAKATGTKVEDVLNKYFVDNLTAKAIGTQINKGAGKGGAYEDRRKVAAENATFGAAQAVITDFGGTKAGQEREADADVALAQGERASKDSGTTILRKQALASLTRAGKIDTNEEAISSFLSGAGSFGAIGDPQQKLIDDEARRILAARTGKAEAGDSMVLTPEDRTKLLNKRLAESEAAGGKPISPGGKAGMEGIVRPEPGFAEKAGGLGADAFRLPAFLAEKAEGAKKEIAGIPGDVGHAMVGLLGNLLDLHKRAFGATDAPAPLVPDMTRVPATR